MTVPRTEANPVSKPILRALRGESQEVTPIWLMRQAGRYLPEYRALRKKARGFLELCLTPALAAEITIQPVRRFSLDAAILFSDILIVPHALGQRLDYREGEGPVLSPVRSIEDLAHLDITGFESRFDPVWETVDRVRAVLDERIGLIGFAGAPWTVASYMVEGGGSRDFAEVKRWAFADPDGFGMLIERVVESTLVYLDGQIRAGADVIQLFDSWAGTLPERAFQRWVVEPTARIVAALHQSHPTVPIIGFPRGAGFYYDKYFAETGVDALSLDSMVPLSAARNLQAKGPVQGNLDPIMLVVGGSVMREATGAILDVLASGPFVFNLGHGILPSTPLGHVAALVDQVHRGPMR
jgi:uroporphyrinogen decarboxylase